MLTNMPVVIEQHTQWITECIRHMRANGLQRIAATPDASDAWVDHVNEAANVMLLPLTNSS